MRAFKSKNKTRSFIITSLFNTIIAVILTYVVMEKEAFFDVFIISQFIGLSICFFVTVSFDYTGQKETIWMVLGITAGLFAGIFFGTIFSWAYLALFRGVNVTYFFKNVFLSLFVFGIVFGVPIIYFFASREKIIESQKQIQDEKIKRLTVEKEAAMTTLRLLQAQIEPHFLFNTLSNVISLFEIDTEKAKQMLIDFNEYLRISLQRTRQEMITLKQELALVRKYLDIFKIRMGNRLSYEIDDQTGMTELPFPPLILQPLVENSIKYGIEPKVDGGDITIQCAIRKNTLIIEISDTGRGLDEDADNAGVGINNVSQRLENIYGNKAGLTLKQNHPSGIIAMIKVPL